MARVEFQTFPLNFVVVLISASLPCQCVIKFTRGQLYPPVCKNDSHGFLLLISISQCISLFLLSLIIKSRTRLAIKNKTGRLAAINNDASHSLYYCRTSAAHTNCHASNVNWFYINSLVLTVEHFGDIEIGVSPENIGRRLGEQNTVDIWSTFRSECRRFIARGDGNRFALFQNKQLIGLRIIFWSAGCAIHITWSKCCFCVSECVSGC